MSTSLDHEHIRELLGAFAVDAVESGERDAVLHHIATCDDCRSEVDELRRAATMFGFAPTVPSDDLWQRIQNELSPPSSADTITPLFRSRPSRNKLFLWTGSAAAAVLLVLGGVVAGSLLDRFDRSSVDSREQIALRSVRVPGSTQVELRSQDGAMSAKVVLLPDGRGYVLDSNLPALSSDKTYQLWAVMGQSAISAGVLGSELAFSPFMANGDVTAFAITEEVAGGVVASEQHPMLSGVVQHT